jgi:glycosyltransferase involved in cell wall biosynthesis
MNTNDVTRPIAAGASVQPSREGTPPFLSIGLPVYNGSLHLAEAIESLLSQDIDDLELVICDNASTDATPQICADYASKDGRIRYVRNDMNIGAAANFNLAFELCDGTHFMWASHDDVWEPQFASTCIAKLELHPEAVLCTSQVQLIGDDGHPKAETYHSMDTTGMSASERVLELLRRPVWYDMYSVFRPSALRSTGMYSPTFGGDVHLLLELALLGDFLTVPDVLLKYRIPDTLKTPSQMTTEIGVHTEKREQHEEPWSFLARDLADVIKASDLGSAAIDGIVAAFVQQLATRDSSWGRAIMRERGWVILPPDRVARREVQATLRPQTPLSPSAIALKRLQSSVVRVGKRVKAAGRRLRQLLNRGRT